jgi:PEP-CTERM motif
MASVATTSRLQLRIHQAALVGRHCARLGGRRLTAAVVGSAMLLSVGEAIMPANADVHLGTCPVSHCISLVVDNSVVISKSLTKEEERAGQVVNLPIPPRLEGPSAGQGIGLLDAHGNLIDLAYFDSTDTNIVFQSDAENGLTVPPGVMLIKATPETELPQIIFSIPTLQGGLAQIYVQSDVGHVPEPADYLMLLAGLAGLGWAGRRKPG